MTSKIFKQIQIVVMTIMFPAIVVAQEISDTIVSQELNELIVEAPKVIRKSDMDVYYPSKSAVENSRNGIQLLSNLMIPTLSVTEALGTIKSAGQTVQVRINGRVSTMEDVKALLPETVKRVEWIDNPGLRFNGASYVLNFIVSNLTLGGSLVADTRQALNTAWGDYFVDSKFNNGPSQFTIGGLFKLTNKIKTHRDYSETFTYPDGNKLTRIETPRGGNLDNSFGRLRTSYSYIKPDTTIFFAEIGASNTFTDNWTYKGLLTLSDGNDDLLLTDSHGSKGATPYISAYFEQHFKNKQLLVMDFNGSFYLGKSYSDYIENRPNDLGNLTDIHTMIKDRNRALAIEADYIKNWRNSRFTTGVSYSTNRNRSKYENLGGEIFHQRQDKLYLFAEYFQRINKVTLTAGIGAQYTDFRFKETNQGSHSWNLRPQATLTYGINQSHQFKLSFETWQSAPTLAQTNIAPLQIDAFQWQIGNPNLKTSNSYMLTLRYNYYFPIVSGTFGIRAFSSPNAITPLLYWENDRLITSYENSKGLQNLSFFVAPQIDIIPQWLMASGYLQYRVERMKGTGYKLYNHNWSGNVDLRLMHWGFVLLGHYERAQHDLWGEKISWGESVSVIQLLYNWKDWQFGAGVIMPFGKYDQGSKMLSKWNSNEQHMRLDMKMPFVSVSYNLQWGRQRNGANKLINADASVDKSSTGKR